MDQNKPTYHAELKKMLIVGLILCSVLIVVFIVNSNKTHYSNYSSENEPAENEPTETVSPDEERELLGKIIEVGSDGTYLRFALADEEIFIIATDANTLVTEGGIAIDRIQADPYLEVIVTVVNAPKETDFDFVAKKIAIKTLSDMSTEERVRRVNMFNTPEVEPDFPLIIEQ